MDPAAVVDGSPAESEHLIFRYFAGHGLMRPKS